MVMLLAVQPQQQRYLNPQGNLRAYLSRTPMIIHTYVYVYTHMHTHPSCTQQWSHCISHSYTVSFLRSGTASFLWLSSVVKNPPANSRDIRDAGSVPGLGRSPAEGHGNPLPYSCMDNRRDRRGLQSIELHRVAHSWSDWAVFKCLIWVLGAPNCSLKEQSCIGGAGAGGVVDCCPSAPTAGTLLPCPWRTECVPDVGGKLQEELQQDLELPEECRGREPELQPPVEQKGNRQTEKPWSGARCTVWGFEGDYILAHCGEGEGRQGVSPSSPRPRGAH